MNRADAIVVLGCRVMPSGGPSPTLARRAATGARAYAQGLAGLVVASGGKRWGAHLEARVIRGELERAGVPSEAIVEEASSLSTYENAVFTARMLRLRSAENALVVTCPWHMARALAAFRAVGIHALPYATDEHPMPLWHQAYRNGREVLSRWIDGGALRLQSRVVAEGALAS